MSQPEPSSIGDKFRDILSGLVDDISDEAEARKAKGALRVPQGGVQQRKLSGLVPPGGNPSPSSAWKSVTAFDEVNQSYHEYLKNEELEISNIHSQEETRKLKQQIEQANETFRWVKRQRIISIVVMGLLVVFVIVAVAFNWDAATAVISAATVQLFNLIINYLKIQSPSQTP